MTEKIVGLILGTVLLAHCWLAQAQMQRNVPHIGYLATDSHAPTRQTFREGLRSFGYIEGKTIFIDWRFAEDKPDRYPELAGELVGLKPDAIVAGNSIALKVLQHATTTIPIVIASYAGDPVADGVVGSLARPGGNITGVIALSQDLSGKHVELLKETIPKIARIGVIWNPDDSGAQSSWDVTQAAAKSLGLQIIALDIRVPGDFDKLAEAATRSRIDAILVLRGGIAYFLRKQIAALTQQHKLPGIYYAAEFVEAGGLMSYASNNEAQYRRAAYYVDKILRGSKPGDLPIEQPTKFEFVINLKTAKQIGLNIPPNVLARADRVIR